MEELFRIEYSCNSPLTEDEEKYISEINGSILAFDKNVRYLEIAGKFSLSYLNLMLADSEGYNIPYIFDTEEQLEEIGKCLYDFENNRFNDHIEEELEDIIAGNLLIIHYIEIGASYRGRNLGAMVIKDAINRFGHNCSLAVVRIFTLQHSCEETHDEDEKEWMENLKLEDLEQDEEQAFYKLAAYFQRLGFVNINKDDIFVLNLAKITPLDDIKLQ